MRFTRFSYHKNNLPSLTSSPPLPPSPPLPSYSVDSEMLVSAHTQTGQLQHVPLPRASLRLTDRSRFRNP